MRKILDILPAGFRRRSFGIVATLFARAALDFAGLAALLPLLMLALDPAALSGEGASPVHGSGAEARRRGCWPE